MSNPRQSARLAGYEVPTIHAVIVLSRVVISNRLESEAWRPTLKALCATAIDLDLSQTRTNAKD